ncbi:hypothetical protein [Pseudonocardia adelaidensis]|uniref:Uncharacterized protein n=1 Tax=Pseudonocardia adelaidensis TaxID=648754 RepID=A0ABP9NKQ6_9PSEU
MRVDTVAAAEIASMLARVYPSRAKHRGVHGGVRAVEQLRLVLAEVKVATVRSQVALGTFTDFELTEPGEPGRCRPTEHEEKALHDMVGELVAWSAALKPLRETANAA